MALRRSRSTHRGDDGHKKGFADRIATATKPDPSRSEDGQVPVVLNQGLTRYQRRTANLPSGATPMTGEERSSIVIDLRHEEDAPDE